MVGRIGILTSGGDAPGLNAVIRAVVLAAENQYGWQVVGIREGFDGLIHGLPPVNLTLNSVSDLLWRGGTILGATNKGSPLKKTVTNADGDVIAQDLSQQAVAQIDHLGLDALVAVGGNGTMSIAYRLVQQGAPIVGVPKTIDNDLAGTDFTFGFNTAIQTVTEALEKLKTTGESHHRVMVLEVMGGRSGWIALFAGLAGGADVILIPEIPFDLQIICRKIHENQQIGRHHSLIVVAEGVVDATAPVSNNHQPGYEPTIGQRIGARLAGCTDADIRVTVLGHVQRGGRPTAHDRWMATGYGVAALRLIEQKRWGMMIALKGTEIIEIPMQQAIQRKVVDPESTWVQIARQLGIVFG